jgi:hypothetical protein
MQLMAQSFEDWKRCGEGKQRSCRSLFHTVNPPQYAAVFGVDEKTAIKALDRLDPVLPLFIPIPTSRFCP